ncbi:MAG: isoleucine--tRNA ligase, partial [Anaerolineae bacterium]|nr:isoleucine--tRNA ligase [Anaerolineae bacterium]
LFPKLRQAVTALDPMSLAHQLQSGQAVPVDVSGVIIELLPAEAQVRMRAREGLAVADAGGVVVGIDTHLSPELVQEGLARDLVRRIQDARKAAGFAIEDRIALTYQADDTLNAVFAALGAYIAEETLAVQMVGGQPAEGSFVDQFELDGEPITLSVQKVA